VARPCRILTELPGPPRTFALYRHAAVLSAFLLRDPRGAFSITAVKTTQGPELEGSACHQNHQNDSSYSALRPSQPQVAGYGARMRGMPTHGLTGRVASHPSAILLFVQLLGVLVYPFMEQGGVGAVLFEVFGALVLALAIWATRESPGPTWIAVTLAIAASSLSIADEIYPSPAMDAASGVLHALFYFWAAASLMVYMLADRTVTTDELFAVGATFTLVAWGFAYVFDVLQIFQPGCFIAAVKPEQSRGWMELLFLSFTNLSSTGLSDVVPVTGQSRSVVMIEQVAGLGYVALFVSRLVGLTIAWQMTSSGDKPSGGN
jgi:Ion channel